MRIQLNSLAGKFLVLAVCLVAAGSYVAFCATEFLAAHLAAKQDVASLQKAIRLQPDNSEYRYLLGRNLWLVQRAPEAAVAALQAAVALNPYQSRYWFDLAGVYDLLGDSGRQKNALERAIQADPTTPEVAWQAANFYIVRGETNKALSEFRVVLENDPYLPPAALELCWRIQPDVNALLRDVVPPLAGVHELFLAELLAKKETEAASRVWARIAELQQPIEKSFVFGYIQYLVSEQQVDQARVVWQQAGSLAGLSAYQPTSENLLINGDFSLEMLNGGFDWVYQKSGEASLALDPTQFHTGNRSLQIAFDSRGLNNVPIWQLIPVQPNANYDFAAFYKTEDLQGVGGPRFAIQDRYTGTSFYTSDDLKDADFWKHITGSFTTGPDTRMVLLQIQRYPAGSPIKGKLWIDGLRLVQKQP